METPAAITPQDVLSFWREAGEKRWWSKDEAFDADIRAKFFDLLNDAAAGKLAHWQQSDDGALALVIVLDQFSRNIFRDDARAFSADSYAREVADRAIASGVDLRVAPDLRPFFYLPFMHSERLADQKRCVALFEQIDGPENLKFAVIHADIIRKFGRFPHRNRILGGVTTPDEQAFLDGGGFSG